MSTCSSCVVVNATPRFRNVCITEIQGGSAIVDQGHSVKRRAFLARVECIILTRRSSNTRSPRCTNEGYIVHEKKLSISRVITRIKLTNSPTGKPMLLKLTRASKPLTLWTHPTAFAADVRRVVCNFARLSIQCFTTPFNRHYLMYG